MYESKDEIEIYKEDNFIRVQSSLGTDMANFKY